MSEMRMEKISWVKREMNRTKKLPSTATTMTTITTSQIPTQIRPTMYSRPWALQNWRWTNKERDLDQNVFLQRINPRSFVRTAKNASSNSSRGPEKPMTRTGWAANKQKMTPWTQVEIMSSDTPIIFSVLSARWEPLRLVRDYGFGWTEINDCLDFIFYPEVLRKWWQGRGQRSRWRWRRRWPEGSERPWSRWGSGGNDAWCLSPFLRTDSPYGPGGPPSVLLDLCLEGKKEPNHHLKTVNPL